MPLPYLPLQHRADFLAAAASGCKSVHTSVIVQSRLRPAAGEAKHLPAHDAVRAGFTATRTLGGAVKRNRARRRLKAAAAKLLAEFGMPGSDYVFIGRKDTLTAAFDDLIDDMKHALKRLADRMRTPL